jgi:hypothetical protein
MRLWWVVTVIFAAALTPGLDAAEARKAENLIIVTIDGLRWQEVFTGAEEKLIDPRVGGVKDAAQVRKDFWRETPAQRRAALMPFFWSMIAGEGQVFGDAEHNCVARVTNGKNFSYPGYSEMFCGLVDPRIDSNDKVPNANLNVLEFLNARQPFAGRVAVFAGWDVFPFILNANRAKMPVIAGWEALTEQPLSEVERQINHMKGEVTRIWPNATFDAMTMLAAEEHLKKKRPRVLYIAFNEVDEWAHLRRYDLYLQAARNNDRAIARLWGMVQEMEQYTGKTALLLTTDHGRGSNWNNWIDHGRIAESDRVWVAVMGPDTAPLGVRKDCAVTTSQVAATVAGLLGVAEEFGKAAPNAAGEMAGVVPNGR